MPRVFRTADLWLIHAAICLSIHSSWTCFGVGGGDGAERGHLPGYGWLAVPGRGHIEHQHPCPAGGGLKQDNTELIGVADLISEAGEGQQIGAGGVQVRGDPGQFPAMASVSRSYWSWTEAASGWS
jgi:hypothetical protein